MPGLTLFLNKRAHTEADRLAVLVIGAATDLASGLLADTALGDRIEIMAMAFDAWPDGGDSFNVGNDLTAWRTLLGSGAPIAVGDAAVTPPLPRRRRQAGLARQARRGTIWLGCCARGSTRIRSCCAGSPATPPRGPFGIRR